MADKWMIRGVEYGNCNCAWGCPCQFNSPSTHGHCEAVATTMIAQGNFNDVSLDGLNFVILFYWPGEIAEGNGRMQLIIDERADDAQREAIQKITRGESTAPGATHYFVFASTMSDVLKTVYAPIECSIDVEACRASVRVPGIVDSTGGPIINPHSGEEFRAGIHLPNGFEYTHAQMGSGTSRVTGDIELDLSGSYGQFNILHMNQDGVIRQATSTA